MAYIGKRPGTVTAVAVILFIVGGWSLLAGLCGGGIALAWTLKAAPDADQHGKVDPNDPAAVQRFMADEVPGYVPVTMSLLVIDILLGVGQLAVGIGLLRMSNAARLMAILLTLVKLLFTFAGHAYSVFMIVPAQARMMRMNPLPQPMPFDIGRLTEAITWATLLIAAVIQVAIAITIISLLSTARVRAAFAGMPLDAEDEARREFERARDDGPPDTGFRGPPDTGYRDQP